jgi:glycosyltransferase involved in cell wall biosynthesis
MPSSKKIIAVDCFKLVKGEGSSIGIYNYTKNLVQYLSQLDKYKIIIFGNSLNKVDFDIDGVIFKVIPISIRGKVIYILWELFFVNYYIFKYNIKLTVFPRGYLPLFKLSKTINTIHDLIPFYYYQFHRSDINLLENYYIRKRLLSSAARSDQVICISNYTKKELLNLCPESKGVTSVAYNGYNELNYRKYNSNDEPYIFSISSSRFKHKNLKGLIKAYSYYFLNNENPLHLHLTGVDSIDEFNLPIDIANHITLYGYLSDEELFHQFSNAKIFLFLSMIEGFGFPPLESMSLGVPVISSNKTSLIEVVGNAGVLVNPGDIQEVSSAIVDLDRDYNLREDLIRKGHENVNKFKWNDMIRKYSDIIDRELEI